MFVYVVHNGEALHIHIADRERQSFEALYDIAKGNRILLHKIIKQVNQYLLSEKKPLVVIPPKELVHLDKPKLSLSSISHVKELVDRANNIFMFSDADIENYYDTVFELRTKTPYLTVLQYCCRRLAMYEDAWKLQHYMSRHEIYSLVTHFECKQNWGRKIQLLLKYWAIVLKTTYKYKRNEFVEEVRKWHEKKQEKQESLSDLSREASATISSSITLQGEETETETEIRVKEQ